MNWNSSHFKKCPSFLNICKSNIMVYAWFSRGTKESCYKVVINLLTKSISIIYGFRTLNFTDIFCHPFLKKNNLVEDSSSQRWAINFLKEPHDNLGLLWRAATAPPPTTTIPPLMLPTPCPPADALPSAAADPSQADAIPTPCLWCCWCPIPTLTPPTLQARLTLPAGCKMPRFAVCQVQTHVNNI